MNDASNISSVEQIVDAIGLTPLARFMGHRNVSTVSSWKRRGSIPVSYWPQVIEAARGQGKTFVTLEALAAVCGNRSAA